MTGNFFLLRLSYILHTIGIENIFDKYFRSIVALKYLLELFQVCNCEKKPPREKKYHSFHDLIEILSYFY